MTVNRKSSCNQHITLHQKIPNEFTGLRLDQTLAQLFPLYSRSQLQNWIKKGFVQLDKKICLIPKHKVLAHQLIEINAELEPLESWEAQEIELTIIYEDNDIIIVNKPAGLCVHPGAGNPNQTLVNALLHYNPDLIQVPRAGVIHRLDKDTSGLLIITKNLAAHHAFTQALKERAIKREYQAIVKGKLTHGGTIRAPIGRHPTHRTKMAVVITGRPAVTHYRIIEKFTAHTFIQVELETGRTHQIRVHMEHIRHPILGDPLYGKQFATSEKLKPFNRQALHAFQLTFTHPLSQKKLQFQAPLPTDMENLLTLLRENL